MVIPSRQAGLRFTRQPSAMYSGFNMIVVSIISTGAGSVAVSARPSLPATDSTSGVSRMTRSCHDMMRFTSVNDVLGSSTGMKSREPSFNVGMNSRPKPANSRAGSDDGLRPNEENQLFGRPHAMAWENRRIAAASVSTVLRRCSAQSRTGS